jgi:tryptophan synthase alpha chain
MKSLTEVFAKAKAENRAALIGFITAGFPELKKSIEVAKAMVSGGVDIIEVGFPYSDPVMDGPVIQRAGEQSLSNGTRTSDVLALVNEISKLGVPTLVMTYWNPVEKYGVAKFTKELRGAGGVGLITPDLTIEESEEWINAAAQNDLAKVYVLAPSSSEDRLEKVSNECSGFIYAASLMGVTGTRDSVSGDASSLVSRIRKFSKLPVSVGLGVSNAEQASAVAKYADGVIVGSAFIKTIQEAENFENGLIKVKELAASLRRGVVR